MCTPCRDDKVAHPNCIHLAYLCTQFVVVAVAILFLIELVNCFFAFNPMCVRCVCASVHAKFALSPFAIMSLYFTRFDDFSCIVRGWVDGLVGGSVFECECLLRSPFIFLRLVSLSLSLFQSVPIHIQYLCLLIVGITK